MKKGDALVEKLKAENLRYQEELRQRTKELSFFINAGKALTSTLEYQKVLKIIIEKAQKLIKCEAWALLILDSATQELRFEIVKGKRAKDLKGLHLKLGDGVAGLVAKRGSPLSIPDVSKDHRYYSGVERTINRRARSILCVPIINKSVTLGVLEMINKCDGHPFRKKDLELLLKLVDQAAIAIERSTLYQKMSDLAITDDLTHLYNFRYLDTALEREVRRCQRYGAPVTTVFLDMDYFKLVNDHHGHLMGSKVLIEVSHILLANLRDVDVVARYGGDEFVIVLPETDVKTAYAVTQRLRKAVRENEFLQEEGLKLRLTASFGIAGFPDHARSKMDLIRLADQAMYKAKGGGRDAVVVTEAE